MFSASRERVRAVSRALDGLQVADLYALSSKDLRALRRQLSRWSYTASSEGRDQRPWPMVRRHLAVLTA